MLNAAMAMGIALDDIEQEAWAGIVLAARRFDPAKAMNSDVNKAFATFANWYPLMGLTRLIAQKTDASKRPAGDARLVSLESLIESDNGDVDPISSIIAAKDRGNAPEQNERTAIMREALQSLPSRHAAILRHRHGIDTEPKTLREIGQAYHLCKERVRQIEREAKRKLAAYFERKGYALESLVA